MSVPSDHERRIRVLEGATYLCSPKQVHGVKVQARIDLAGWLQIDVTADESVKGWALIYNGRSIPISVDSAALVSLTEERKQLEARLAQAEDALAAAHRELDDEDVARTSFGGPFGDIKYEDRTLNLVGRIHILAQRGAASVSRPREAAEACLVQAEEAISQALLALEGEFAAPPDSQLASQWLRTTFPPDHPNHVDRAALRSLGDTPEKAEDIGGNRVARSKTERSEP